MSAACPLFLKLLTILLLGVNGNDRLQALQVVGSGGVDVFELRVAVRVLAPFPRLLNRLQAIPKPVE
jgi:hypothetical protein